MATIYDVARRANVSTTTVSKVLSNTPYVSTQTKERVLEAMRDLKYAPSLAARGLSRNRTYVIGLVIPYDPDYLFSDPFLLEIIRGIEACTNEHDYNLLLSLARRAAEPRSAYSRMSRTGYMDGVITIETFEGDEAAKEFEERQLPRVSIGYRKEPRAINSIHADDYRGAFEGITYLLKLGHRQIGIVSGPPAFIGAIEERLGGAQAALAQYGLRLDSNMITYGDFTIESGYRAAEPLLTAQPRPTAIFAMNDRMASGVLRRAREYNLSIPADLSLVGFDDVPLSMLVEPSLTTIHQPGYELGQRATQKLFEILDHDLPSFDPIVLPVELIIRGSTAPPSHPSS